MNHYQTDDLIEWATHSVGANATTSTWLVHMELQFKLRHEIEMLRYNTKAICPWPPSNTIHDECPIDRPTNPPTSVLVLLLQCSHSGLIEFIDWSPIAPNLRCVPPLPLCAFCGLWKFHLFAVYTMQMSNIWPGETGSRRMVRRPSLKSSSTRVEGDTFDYICIGQANVQSMQRLRPVVAVATTTASVKGSPEVLGDSWCCCLYL